MCLLGVSMMNNYLGAQSPPKPPFGGPNRHFKPNMRKIQIAISSDLCIRLTLNLTGSCGQQQRLRGWSHVVIKQFQDGGRPQFWKSIYRHISVNKLSCRRDRSTRRFVSLNILLSHSKSFEMTLLSRACVNPYWYFIETMSVCSTVYEIFSVKE